jgi:DedD protein
MIRDFSREELEPLTRDHTELTLGLGTVLALGVGLVLLCTVCFALGYAVGHRTSPAQNTAIVVPDSTSAYSSARTGTKPGATRAAATPASPDAAMSDSESERTSTTQSTPDSASEASSAQSANAAQVKPALQSQAGAASDAPIHVQPATSQVQGWMVQIAAVSRTEDADVLVGALKKRGYAVSARRELGDNLIHVQTGPFTNRTDANAMRQKLLNDGYNAIVQ